MKSYFRGWFRNTWFVLSWGWDFKWTWPRSTTEQTRCVPNLIGKHRQTVHYHRAIECVYLPWSSNTHYPLACFPSPLLPVGMRPRSHSREKKRNEMKMFGVGYVRTCESSQFHPFPCRTKPSSSNWVWRKTAWRSAPAQPMRPKKVSRAPFKERSFQGTLFSLRWRSAPQQTLARTRRHSLCITQGFAHIREGRHVTAVCIQVIWSPFLKLWIKSYLMRLFCVRADG